MDNTEKEKYLMLSGIDKEKMRESRQRLLKLDTYGFAFWIEKDFEWQDDLVVCQKRDIILNLDEGDFRSLKEYGSFYVYDGYLISVGNYEGVYPKDFFESVYRYFKGIK